MGFMDNIKKAQDMAQEAAQGMGGSMQSGIPDQGDVAYSQLAQKVWNQGLPGVATIKTISETGKTDLSGKQYAVDVSVELGGETYDTTVVQYFQEASVGSYQPGNRFEIKVDPDDKTKGLLYGPA